MARIKGSEPNPLPAERAARANPPNNGPHKPGAKRPSETANPNEPAYVVAVTKKESSENADGTKANRYKPSPEALREKARALLYSDKLSPKETAVLKEILEPTEK